MPPLSEILQHVGPALHEYGMWAIFLNLLLETFGLPLPGETLLIAAALLATKGDLSLPLLLATAWSAAVLGDNIAFYFGRSGGRHFLLRFGGIVGITPQPIDKMEQFYQRFGPEVVIVARFFVIARQLNGLVAGASGMPQLRFFIYNLIGAALWVGTWGMGAYYLGDHIKILLKWSSQIMLPFMAITIGVSAIFLIYRIWHNRK